MERATTQDTVQQVPRATRRRTAADRIQRRGRQRPHRGCKTARNNRGNNASSHPLELEREPLREGWTKPQQQVKAGNELIHRSQRKRVFWCFGMDIVVVERPLMGREVRERENPIHTSHRKLPIGRCDLSRNGYRPVQRDEHCTVEWTHTR